MTVLISFRVEIRVKERLQDLAEGKGMTLSDYVKKVVESYISHIDKAMKPLDEVPEHLRVAGQPSNATIPIYNKDVHRPGDRVLVRMGKHLVEKVVPETDAEGNIIPEVK